jgi:hypothetical protein
MAFVIPILMVVVTTIYRAKFLLLKSAAKYEFVFYFFFAPIAIVHVIIIFHCILFFMLEISVIPKTFSCLPNCVA